MADYNLDEVYEYLAYAIIFYIFLFLLLCGCCCFLLSCISLIRLLTGDPYPQQQQQETHRSYIASVLNLDVIRRDVTDISSSKFSYFTFDCVNNRYIRQSIS